MLVWDSRFAAVEDEPLTLGFGGESLVGLRDSNEDAEVLNESLGVFGTYFGVFDGHAGRRLVHTTASPRILVI